MARRILIAILGFHLLALSGCGSTVTRYQKTERPRRLARWAMLPFVNHSETPQAGERVEAILGTLLRARGVRTDDHAPAKDDEARLTVTDAQRLDEALAWARAQKFDYAVTGSVEEWRYKAGVDGEPAIGVTVRIVEIAKNATVWSASGSKTGVAAENVSGTALRLLDTIVSELELGQ